MCIEKGLSDVTGTLLFQVMQTEVQAIGAAAAADEDDGEMTMMRGDGCLGKQSKMTSPHVPLSARQFAPDTLNTTTFVVSTVGSQLSAQTPRRQVHTTLLRPFRLLHQQPLRNLPLRIRAPLYRSYLVGAILPERLLTSPLQAPFS